MTRLRVLDLFSGIGGFSLGLERTGGFQTVAFCEIDPFPRRVLTKHWPSIPIHDDVRALKGADVGAVDVICGGYPCQPFSSAGKRQGAKDDRHLWPEFMRLVAELRPSWVIGENVAGHISMGLDDVLADLEAEGYACRTFVIPACAVGASHRRDRVWTVAHAQDDGRQISRAGNERCNNSAPRQFGVRSQPCGNGASRHEATMADAISLGRSRQGQSCVGRSATPESQGKADHAFAVSQRSKRRAQSGMGGVAHGFSFRLDEPQDRVKNGVPDRAARLKALGNAVHPDIPMMIGHAILAAEDAA